MFCFNLRPQSSRYCQQPLLNNLAAFLAMSIIASGTFQKAVFNCTHTKSINNHDLSFNTFMHGIVQTGFSVLFTVIEPVPSSFRAAYHVFGLISFGQGLCTTMLTLTATSCVSQASLCFQSTSIFSGCKQKCV